MMNWIKTINFIVFALVLKKVCSLVLLLQFFKAFYNHAPGECQLVPPVVSGSEDIQMLDENKALITSGLKFGSAEKFKDRLNIIGQIFMYDFSTPQKAARVVACDNFPDYGTNKFNPHGMFIYRHAGETLLFVVNHPLGQSYETVEKFSFNLKSNELRHLKTYTSDLFHSINDVIAVGPDSFYVTNVSYFRKGLLNSFEVGTDMLHWASVVYYDRGTSSVAVDSLYLANGINISTDNKYVYVQVKGEVRVYLRSNEGVLKLVQAKKLHSELCDNIEVEKATGDLWVTCHPVPYKLFLYLNMATEDRPFSPSQVLRVKTKNGLLTDDITEVYQNDGTQFQASSTTVYHAKTSSMLVGSVDNTLMHCKVNYLL